MTDFDKLHVNNFMFKTCIPLESQYNCILIFRLFIFFIGYDGHHFIVTYSYRKFNRFNGLELPTVASTTS